MAHPFMAAVAEELGERGIATLRFQFPYMEQGSKRPDAPKIAHATVRAATAKRFASCLRLPLFAGRKILWRSHDVASPGRGAARGRASDWRFSAFRCTQPDGRLVERGEHLFECAKFRCSSCRERVTRSPSLSELEPLCEALSRARP